MPDECRAEECPCETFDLDPDDLPDDAIMTITKEIR